MISLVIPCYNESDRFSLLQGAILEFDRAWPDPFEVILVNDGSSDNTWAKMNILREQDMRNGVCQLINLPQNINKGGALKAGVNKANGSYILTLDADMSTAPSQLLTWQKRIPDLLDDDVIYIGSRGHLDSDLDALENRKKLGSLFNQFINCITPLKLVDTQCGFKLYPSGIAKELFNNLENLGWAHDIEILTRAYYQNIQVRPLPIKWVHVDGSKINVLRDGIKMAIESIKISRRLKSEYRN